MPTALKAPIAVLIGLAATGVLIAADVLAWPLGTASAGLLGALAGLTSGYLVPSPSEQAAKAIAP